VVFLFGTKSFHFVIKISVFFTFRILYFGLLVESNDEYDLHMVYDELCEKSKELLKVYKISLKELEDVKHEKESLVIQLSESLALIDSLKSKNTMLIDIVESLADKLEKSKDLLNKLSSDNLKSILCVKKDVSNKPSMIIDDLGTSTSHASDSEINSQFIKPVKVDEVKANTACLKNCDNSCLNNCVKPEVAEPQNAYKDKGKTFVIVSCENANIKLAVPVIKHSKSRSLVTYHHCGIVGHIRPNCCQRPWNKKDAPKKEKCV